MPYPIGNVFWYLLALLFKVEAIKFFLFFVFFIYMVTFMCDFIQSQGFKYQIYTSESQIYICSPVLTPELHNAYLISHRHLKCHIFKWSPNSPSKTSPLAGCPTTFNGNSILSAAQDKNLGVKTFFCLSHSTFYSSTNPVGIISKINQKLITSQ